MASVFVIVDQSGGSRVAIAGEPPSSAAAWLVPVPTGETDEQAVAEFVTAQGFALNSRVYMVDATQVTQFKVAGRMQALTLPDAPTGPTATAGESSATVSWTPPASDGGTALLGYIVTPYKGAVAQTPVQVGPQTSIVLTGLADGMSYTFEVQAVNSVGIGPSSDVSNAVVPSATPSVPSTPTNVTAVGAPGQATISWTAPASDGGKPITDYNVFPHVGGTVQAPVAVAGSPPPTAVTVIGLTNGTAYTFTVKAINSVGASPESQPSPAVTPG